MIYLLVSAVFQVTYVTAFGEATAMLSGHHEKTKEFPNATFEPHTFFKVVKIDGLAEMNDVGNSENKSNIATLLASNGPAGNRPKKKFKKSKKSKHRRRHRGKGNSRQNRHSAGGFERKTCMTQTSNEFKTEAEDIFGHKVEIHPEIPIGRITVDQFFYESYCAEEKCKCAGINKKMFTSSCETTYSYTYARAVKNGEIGWTYIKVRSGCSCSIQEVENYPENVWDML